MKKGFTLIEIMLAVALAAVILPALIGTLGFSLQSSKQNENFTNAYALAQEQMEAVYTIRNRGDASWEWTSSSPENTSTGEYYQPHFSSGKWLLGSKTSSPSENDGFTKKVEIIPVKRDALDVLSDDPWAMEDDNSRLVKVSVSWKENSEIQEVELETLLTRY